MNARFGQSGPVHKMLLRERLIYIGGGAITFTVTAIVAAIVYSYNEVEARQTIVAPQESADQLAFGTVVLLAPSAPVPQGTKLDQIAVREIHWPRNEVPEGAVRRQEDIEGMYSKIDLPPNQPILRANLQSTPLLGGVVDLIPPGHRATTIEVDATSGVEGWATPGAHVDVLVTYHDSAEGMKKSQIAVENAVVVSYNGQIKSGATAREGSQRPSSNPSSATVTLAVPVLDAVKIHTARAMGRISLILRNTSDIRSVSDSTVAEDDLKNTKAETKAQRSEPAGFVRFTDSTGAEKHLELRSDKKWWIVSDSEE